MAIAFNCPHCQFAYRLPDKFAGKQAKCKNPECRKVITIPAPVTIPDDDVPQQSAEELEAAALSALSEDAPPSTTNEEEPQSTTEEKVIPVTCPHCDHKWTVPWAKAGKNVLCPNDECRKQVRVPEPKEDVPDDWRRTKTKLPSGAKQHFEKLEGVVDAEETKIVSGKALKEADAIDEGIEPRPLKDWIYLGLGVVGLFGAIVFGIWYLFDSRTESKEEQLWEMAHKELEENTPNMNPEAAVLSSALLNLTHAQYELRKNTAEATQEAQNYFNKARGDIRKQAPSPVRSAIVVELALTLVAFGGTDEQVEEQVRIPWLPDTTGRVVRINERTQTVYQELTATLPLLQGTSSDVRMDAARRLARELVKRGQADLAADLIPKVLFPDQDSTEARAIVALEIHRADSASATPRRIAEEFKAAQEADASAAKARKQLPNVATPPWVGILFNAVGVEKAADAFAPNYRSDQLAETARHLFEGRSEEAIATALSVGATKEKWNALALCAEWGDNPAAVFSAAQKAIQEATDKRAPDLPGMSLLRLARAAGAAGQPDVAKAFIDKITDPGLKAWAMGEVIRVRVLAKPEEKADETWLEVPANIQDVRAGHAWGRFWIARENAHLSGSRSDEEKAIVGWPTAVRPLALAGIALGLGDE